MVNRIYGHISPSEALQDVIGISDKMIAGILRIRGSVARYSSRGVHQRQQLVRGSHRKGGR